jgi:hypothetical protein
MTRDELIAVFRIDTQDTVGPRFFFETPWVAQWLAEAEAEAAIRGRLLHEAQSPRVCEIDVSAGVSVYPLHSALYEISHIAFRPAGASRRERVVLASAEELDRTWPSWRDEQGQPRYAIQGDTSIRLAPMPDAAGTLLLEGYRLPLKSLAESGTSSPEIHQAHHRHLIAWAKYRAFSIPDSETLDLGKAGDALREFTGYFGERPDSDLRRITREDGPHHNVAWT